jgi:hypothetical protein
VQDIATGRNLRGFILVGRGVRHLHDAQLIEGYASSDIDWPALQQPSASRPRRAILSFWLAVCVVGALLAGTLTHGLHLTLAQRPPGLPFLALTVASTPGSGQHIGVLRQLSTRSDFGAALGAS